MAGDSGMLKNPIRAAAVTCVAITSAFIMWMGYRINEVLAGPLWCSRAIGADKAASDSKIDAASSCIGLLTIQLKSLATNSHILLGSLALCLLTLIVIVIAGANNLDLAGLGGSLHIGKGQTPAAKAASETAAAAVDKAGEIAADQPPVQMAPGEQG